MTIVSDHHRVIMIDVTIGQGIIDSSLTTIIIEPNTAPAAELKANPVVEVARDILVVLMEVTVVTIRRLDLQARSYQICLKLFPFQKTGLVLILRSAL